MTSITPLQNSIIDVTLLTDPITLDLYKDPVIAEDGHTYEREAILQWIREKGNSPFTRQPLDINKLHPNIEIKRQVAEYIKLEYGGVRSDIVNRIKEEESIYMDSA
ncbi:unnamed protein product [Didymodactylos carnosus]|uniref:U-box domain-containing protein n=1 Tax=Didymodactylos carnosus TaxID=1234261 RepID=A0A814J999_9BILA|nr:unnamed protein product [Didymodactylos carnosus]CAF1094347.1 unnamed protein product [Didymodactylos carnosus]CAF3805559.1 unnamed protein product [Didymodactylos carnosus]CAF3855801.1 unnamed protein product [Didymodactylos carnosus]